ncbi:hypothetical protein VTH8203_01524 [Vibrio thalassae]|uniref:Uncharacterized protein n=1 Tax=Vibrio thalassae TaxID=1243014 RepID=A0A240EIA8_9VIBR|nr:hypothetical protein [Vibrio thalassae]SNX47909.1 hypothetical protein VTH8203_01524 [Vibrio thalassae]
MKKTVSTLVALVAFGATASEIAASSCSQVHVNLVDCTAQTSALDASKDYLADSVQKLPTNVVLVLRDHHELLFSDYMTCMERRLFSLNQQIITLTQCGGKDVR